MFLIEFWTLNCELKNYTISRIYIVVTLLLLLIKLNYSNSIVLQKGQSKPYITEEQTRQWPQKKSTKQTYKTKDRVTRTRLKTGDEFRCSGRVSSSCSTSGTRRVNLVTNPVISREWGKDREVLTTSGTYPWSFVTQQFNNDQPSNDGDRNIFELMTSTLPKGTIGSVASSLAATLYQGNPDRNPKLWNIVLSTRYILHMQMLLECFYI